MNQKFRQIAGEYHYGEASSLYSYHKTGIVINKTLLTREIREAITSNVNLQKVCRNVSDYDELREEESELREFLKIIGNS